MQVSTPSIEAPARAALRIVPLSMLAGAALGATYGAVMRLWMRFISEDPEFTWAGTFFIVGAFAISFAFVGLVVAGRRRGWKAAMVPARTGAIVVSLSCFGGAGVLMLPTVVLGSLAWARTDWPLALRRVLGLFSAVSVLLAAGGAGELSSARLALAVVWYLAMVVIEIRVLSEPYRPTVARLPLVLKVASIAVPVLLVLGFVLLTVGASSPG